MFSWARIYHIDFIIDIFKKYRRRFFIELSVIKTKDENDVVVLLDDNMRIIKPAQNYLNQQVRLGRSVNTLVANGRDLKVYWDFLNCKGYDYEKITPVNIGEFIEFLRSPNNIDGNFTESKRTGKTVNRILSTVYCFYKYCCMISEIENPIMMKEINRPQNMFKGLLHHTLNNKKTKKSVFKIKESDAGVTIIPNSQIERILDALSTERDRLILKLLYLTGARIGEVLDLKIENIPHPNYGETFGVLKNGLGRTKTKAQKCATDTVHCHLRTEKCAKN